MEDAPHEAQVEDSDWVLDYGLELRARAQSLLAEVEILLLRRRPREAENLARRSLGSLASSLNWLEDTAEFDRAHELMDLAGRYVCLTFGCELRWQGEYYEQTCPVWIAHTRIGISPELLIRDYECSICGEDSAACPHISGREYDGSHCVHQPKDMQPLGVAWVKRPSQPDARIAVIPMTVEQLEPTLPAGWKPRTRVPCSRCLQPCEGVQEVDLTPPPTDDPEAWTVDESQPPLTITIMLANTPMKT